MMAKTSITLETFGTTASKMAGPILLEANLEGGHVNLVIAESDNTKRFPEAESTTPPDGLTRISFKDGTYGLGSLDEEDLRKEYDDVHERLLIATFDALRRDGNYSNRIFVIVKGPGHTASLCNHYLNDLFYADTDGLLDGVMVVVVTLLPLSNVAETSPYAEEMMTLAFRGLETDEAFAKKAYEDGRRVLFVYVGSGKHSIDRPDDFRGVAQMVASVLNPDILCRTVDLGQCPIVTAGYASLLEGTNE